MIENLRPMLDLIAWSEDRLNLETVQLLKPADVDADLISEMIGRQLSYRLIADDIIISLFVRGSDQISEPRLILRVGMDRQNIRLLARVIKTLEFSKLKDLDAEIIELGDIGPQGIIIGGD